MRLSTLIYVFVFLISKKTQATIHESIQTGNWNSISTWDTGVTPTISDTVIINRLDTVFINTSGAFCNSIIINGVVFFKSATNQITSFKSKLDNGEISASALGTFSTSNLSIEGISKIGKCHLSVTDSLLVKGNLDLSSASGNKSIKHVLIEGTLTNSANENILISGNIISHREVNFGEGEISFLSPAYIQGNWIISEALISDSLITLDSLEITNKIEGTGYINNKGVLSLGMTNSNFNIDSLVLSKPKNELILKRNGNQRLPRIANSSFQKISFLGSGSFTISDSIIGKSLNIYRDAKVSIEAELIADSIHLDNNATLKTFNNFYLDSISFWDNHKNSTIEVYNNQTLNRSIQFGNIIIDGANTITGFYPDTIFVGGDFNQSGTLNGDAIIYYNGNEKQTIKERDYRNLIYANDGIDSSVFYGDFNIDSLLVLKGKLKIGSLVTDYSKIERLGTLQIGGHSPIFNDTLLLKGQLIINSNSAAPHFYWLNISEGGSFQNESTADISIQHGILNNGELNGCLGANCIFQFQESKSILLGNDTIKIPKITGEKIYNYGTLSVSKGVELDSFINMENSTLLLQADTQNIIGYLDFSAQSNSLILNKTGDQVLPKFITLVENLKISENGSKSLANHLNVKQNLIIEKEANLKTDSFQVIGHVDGELIIDSAATLTLGHNFSLNNITFPDQFSIFSIHDSSSVKYASKGNQTISAAPTYGNLIIDDGAISASNKTITGDTLRIKGHLNLIESSLTLIANEKTIDLSGDWNGPGNIEFSSGKFHIAGDGNSDGEIIAGSSEIIYDGKTRQRIKIGTYYDLTVDKINNAFTRANTGSLVVSNKTTVKNGTLEFSTEKCEIENLIIEDSVIFSSKLQEKYFENIDIKPSGLFLLNINEEIFINGNIENDGEFKTSDGIVHFSDSLSNQTLHGSGNYSLSKAEIYKKGFTLKIDADLEVSDTFKITSGKMEINSVIQLENNGYILRETHSNLMFGAGKVSINKSIIPGSYNNIGGIGLDLITSTPLGNTLFEREFTAGSISEDESILRVYNIEPQINAGLNAAISFNFWDSELNGNSGEELEVFKSTDNGINWAKHSGIINLASNTATINEIESFSKWTLWSGSETPLAVELLTFSGERNNDKIYLNWEVLLEIETSHYQINYSVDGINFDSLTTVYPQESMIYNFSWENAPNQTLYFELIEIETSEKVNRLDTIIVSPDLSQAPKAWINGNKLYIENFPVGTINLYNINGKLVFQNKTDISNLPIGKYFIELLSPSKRWTFESWKI